MGSRQGCIVSIEDSVSLGTEREIAHDAWADGGVLPPTHPACGAELGQRLLDAPLARERVGNSVAELEQSPDSQGTAVQGEKNVAIARRDKSEAQMACHMQNAWCGRAILFRRYQEEVPPDTDR